MKVENHDDAFSSPPFCWMASEVLRMQVSSGGPLSPRGAGTPCPQATPHS